MKIMNLGRERAVADARRRLGDERLLAFLRACRNYDDILACKLINDKMDEGKNLDEIFYTGNEYGYLLAVRGGKGGAFAISFGCQAGPTAGDGGTWKVQFDSDGEIFDMQLKDQWIS